jgi:large subunit ribosomal protein L29
MNPDELVVKLEELRRQLFDLRCQAVTEKLENSKGILNIRRDIARIRTVIGQRRRQQPGQAGVAASAPSEGGKNAQ